MKRGAFVIMLLPIFAAQPCCGQTNATSQATRVRRVPSSSVDWKSVSAIAGKKLSVLTLTNQVSQDSTLAVTDRVNANYNIDRYVDGYCGFGARLGRHYLGTGSVAGVSFEWDRGIRRTKISLHGTNAALGTAWQRDM